MHVAIRVLLWSLFSRNFHWKFKNKTELLPCKGSDLTMSQNEGGSTSLVSSTSPSCVRGQVRRVLSSFWALGVCQRQGDVGSQGLGPPGCTHAGSQSHRNAYWLGQWASEQGPAPSMCPIGLSRRLAQTPGLASVWSRPSLLAARKPSCLTSVISREASLVAALRPRPLV